MIHEGDPRIEEGYVRRAAYWDKIGRSEPDFISYLVNPQFQGKPPWPNTRQAYRVVHTLRTIIIASDGLSDPFVGTDMDNASGFAMEVFIETPDLVDASFDVIRTSWAFSIIENFAMNVADWGGITANLHSNPTPSIEFPAQGILPPAWMGPNGAAGFLINTPVMGRQSEFIMPLGSTMIVPPTLLRPTELKFVVEKRKEGRAELIEKLREGGYGHISSLNRPSVL